jgi:signal transduction histidine kinase
MDNSRSERTTMTTSTVGAPSLADATSPATAHGAAAHPLSDQLVHDIRTPLAAIRGYAQLLLRRTATDHPDLAGLAESLRRIEEAATRVGDLLDELTDSFSVPGVGTTSRQREAIDLVPLVERVAAECETAALGTSRVVVLTAAPALVGCWNAVSLKRMLANLVDNALKYNRDAGAVIVSIRHLDGWAAISVVDQGLGIPPAEIESVFQPRYRASNVMVHRRGSGLGLAGAQQIVAAHGGTIALESELGRGTTVTVRLPLEDQRHD